MQTVFESSNRYCNKYKLFSSQSRFYALDRHFDSLQFNLIVYTHTVEMCDLLALKDSFTL